MKTRTKKETAELMLKFINKTSVTHFVDKIIKIEVKDDDDDNGAIGEHYLVGCESHGTPCTCLVDTREFDRFANREKAVIWLPRQVKHKLPEEMKSGYHQLETPFNSFNDFFNQYAEGKRVGHGISSRHLGYANDVTIFWMVDDEWPFAYVYPKSPSTPDKPGGYYFFISFLLEKKFVENN